MARTTIKKANAKARPNTKIIEKTRLSNRRCMNQRATRLNFVPERITDSYIVVTINIVLISIFSSDTNIIQSNPPYNIIRTFSPTI